MQDKKYCVSEPHHGFTLKNLLLQFGKLEECTVKYFLKQIIKTLAKLHQMSISHNRLSIHTLIHDGEGHILINYFKASDSPISDKERSTGVHNYPPQMLLSKYGHRDCKNDIWAIGCIALQLLTNKQLKDSKIHPYNKISLTDSQMKSSMLIQKLVSRG